VGRGGGGVRLLVGTPPSFVPDLSKIGHPRCLRPSAWVAGGSHLHVARGPRATPISSTSALGKPFRAELHVRPHRLEPLRTTPLAPAMDFRYREPSEVIADAMIAELQSLTLQAGRCRRRGSAARCLA